MYNDGNVIKLSTEFYNKYTSVEYPEVLSKGSRAYTCFIFKLNSNTYICIPFRTEIRHKYAYKFKQSSRSKNHSSGLDYTKIVLIDNLNYIDSLTVVDKDEYVEMQINISRIRQEALDYVNGYINHINGKNPLDSFKFKRKYQYSPLKYFHELLLL